MCIYRFDMSDDAITNSYLCQNYTYKKKDLKFPRLAVFSNIICILNLSPQIFIFCYLFLAIVIKLLFFLILAFFLQHLLLFHWFPCFPCSLFLCNIQCLHFIYCSTTSFPLNKTIFFTIKKMLFYVKTIILVYFVGILPCYSLNNVPSYLFLKRVFFSVCKQYHDSLIFCEFF